MTVMAKTNDWVIDERPAHSTLIEVCYKHLLLSHAQQIRHAIYDI